MVVYGGVDAYKKLTFSALVFDIGSHTTRAGYAGEDTPKCVIPTAHGYLDVDGTSSASTIKDGDTTMDDDTLPTSVQTESKDGRVRKYFVGEDGANVWRAGMEVGTLMGDGIIQDPSSLPPLLSHALHSRLRVNPEDHPLLSTEAAWNPTSNREIMAELVFEQENVPAWFTACSGVLSSFAAGKPTSLVVDVGNDLVSITPVLEGYVLKGGTRRQPLAMALLHSQIKSYLQKPNPARSFPLSLTPFQLMKTRTPVPAGQAPRFTTKQDRLADGKTTASWQEYAENKVVENWRESCVNVYETPYEERYVAQRAPRPYEFPDGFNASYGSERYKFGEALFNPQFIDRSVVPPSCLRHTTNTAHSRSIDQVISIAQLAHEAVMACDVDVRAALLSNVVVAGGGSLLAGFTDRFNYELGVLLPGQKIRIHASGHATERRFSSWLGGSVLASLGTFHQLWISKEEWLESGPKIIAQKCK
ncbi:Actin-related protein-Arp4p/Act3p [Phaffia rhodozyma]|uniref:Actin-related protein-Arp4p/Act3p n=1 Tax=Phaffia rhodozyma TaxID=264483 RepID=A0A0F7SEI6_PHARH|nr:Actin-related protein-Arp4p/Act3p [Phaffia rhodozyma]